MFGKATATSARFQSENLLTLDSVTKNHANVRKQHSIGHTEGEGTSLEHDAISISLLQPKTMQLQHSSLIAWAKFSLEREESKATLVFSSLSSACLKFSFALPSQFIFSTQERNIIQLYRKTFRHIYSFFKQTYRSSNCNEEQTNDSKILEILS